MTRDDMKVYFDLSKKISFALQSLPYKDALGPMGALQEMGFLVSQELPGGYCGECPHCEEVKGEDEMVDCGDERICQTCVDGWGEPSPAEVSDKRQDKIVADEKQITREQIDDMNSGD